MAHRCEATRKDGQPCQAWAVADTDPPRCAAHGGTSKQIGAPTGNQNAQTHGFYRRPDRPVRDLADVKRELEASLQRLAAYIKDNIADLDAAEVARLLTVQGMNLSRMARVIKQETDALGIDVDHFRDDIDEALKLASKYLGDDFAH